MNEQEAIELAQKTADLHGWVMAVYFNPYAEYETDAWGYMPKEALFNFRHHELRHTLTPGSK
jgi:hypothetical protein